LKKEIPASTGSEAIANDTAALTYTPDKDGFVEVVFVVNDGEVTAKQVKTGIQSDTHIEIIEGITEGEEIVTGNYRAISQDLMNGSQVVVKENNKRK
jgi:HlyD family secretion protein